MAVTLAGTTPETVVEALAGTPLLRRLTAYLTTTADAITREHLAITEIPAPPFHEAARAAFVADRLRDSGLSSVWQDTEGNVYGWLPGAEKTLARAPIVLAAHLDTVFPPGTNVNVRVQGTRLCAPGIADNACGVAGLLALARAFVTQSIPFSGPVCFIGTVGEEGNGNLRGARAVVEQFPHMRSFIALDGPGLEHITCRAIGSRRFCVTFHGPGGHSWADFGTVNPVHALGEFISRVRRLPLRRGVACTVAIAGGGSAINAIPTMAQGEVDCRAHRMADLDALEHALRLAAVEAQQSEIQQATRQRRLSVAVQRLGERPAGETPSTSPLVRCAIAATRACGRRPVLESGSTDANVPMALGIPAIAIGAGGEYGGCHTLEEWYDPVGRPQALVRAALLVLALDQLMVELPEPEPGRWRHHTLFRPCPSPNDMSRYWLLKSEPGVFSIDDLQAAPNQTTSWEGVRNYQARNFLRDGMQVGDRAFFYHSNATPPGIVGVVEIVRAGYPDHTAFDPASRYYDPKSDPAHPTWFMVDVRLVQKFPRIISLDELKRTPGLENMLVIRRGMRLSVQPVTEAEWQIVLGLVGSADRPV